MATFGLGNFMYDVTVDGKGASFKFYDAQDATNTAEVSISADEIKELGKVDADGREVSELAYARVSKELNDKRDKRVREEQIKELDDRQAEDARAREAAVDFAENSNDVAVQPAREEEDGTRVYNMETADSQSKTDSDAKSEPSNTETKKSKK